MPTLDVYKGVEQDKNPKVRALNKLSEAMRLIDLNHASGSKTEQEGAAKGAIDALSEAQEALVEAGITKRA